MSLPSKLALMGIFLGSWLALGSSTSKEDDEVHPLAVRQLAHPEEFSQLQEVERARHWQRGPFPFLIAAIGVTALLFGPDLARRWKQSRPLNEENHCE